MKNQRKRLEGVVVSNKMEKTVLVEVTRTTHHRLYGKAIRQKKKYMAHDESNSCRMGDHVMIIECRPQSRTKRWAVKEITQRAE
jgi:small subunit ribosomal protein S17